MPIFLTVLADRYSSFKVHCHFNFDVANVKKKYYFK